MPTYRIVWDDEERSYDFIESDLPKEELYKLTNGTLKVWFVELWEA